MKNQLVTDSDITLRDRFAMAALATMAFPEDYPEVEKVADYAYRIADAMLKRREQEEI